jgi:hypothetical protein
VIRTDRREGLDGWWTKTFPVTGGKHYRIHTSYLARNVPLPRRSIVVKLNWQDDKGRKVPIDEVPASGYLSGSTAWAETEFPATGSTDATGWTIVTEVYRAPSKATRAVVELHLQWAANAEVRWCGTSLAETTPPPPRKVKLATVHFRPQGGKTPEGNCRLFEPHIADAARQKADLVVLGETLTYYGLGKSFADVAEPIPGPSTEYFAKLAKARPVHRRRVGRAGGPSHLQHLGLGRSRRQAGWQVPQGNAAAERDRGWHRTRQ